MNEDELDLNLEGDELEFDISEEAQTDLPTHPNQKQEEQQEATEAKSVAFLLNRLGDKGFDLNIKVLPLPPVGKGKGKEEPPNQPAQVWLGVRVETAPPAFKVVEITNLDELTVYLNEFVGQYIEQIAAFNSHVETKAGADIVTTNSAALPGKKARQKGNAANTATTDGNSKVDNAASEQAFAADSTSTPGAQKSGKGEQLSFF
jgi:hypothetical protein